LANSPPLSVLFAHEHMTRGGSIPFAEQSHDKTIRLMLDTGMWPLISLVFLSTRHRRAWLKWLFSHFRIVADDASRCPSSI